MKRHSRSAGAPTQHLGQRASGRQPYSRFRYEILRPPLGLCCHLSLALRKPYCCPGARSGSRAVGRNDSRTNEHLRPGPWARQPYAARLISAIGRPGVNQRIRYTSAVCCALRKMAQRSRFRCLLFPLPCAYHGFGRNSRWHLRSPRCSREEETSDELAHDR